MTSDKDRKDPDRVRAFVAELIEDPNLRRAAIEFLASSVLVADEAGSKRWSLSMRPGRLRLNVGRIQTLLVHEDGVMVVVDWPSLDPESVRVLEPHRTTELGEYATVPAAVEVEVSAATASELFPLLREPHDRLIDLAAETASISPYRSANSSGVIEFLRSELDLVLPDPDYGDALDVAGLIRRVRKEAGPDMVGSRAASEEQARDLLNRAAGNMTREQVHELARTVNRGSWGGKLRHDRFTPGFSVPLIDQMVSDLDGFNDLTNRLWRGTEDEALAVADLVFSDRSVLPGAGRSFPSFLLYLREPTRHAVWFDSLDRGLAAVADYESQDRESGIEGYREYAKAATAFAQEHELEPQEMDAVLSMAAREDVKIRVEAEDKARTPTITISALEFLADLSGHNNKEWFDENRYRYEQHLRDPVVAVLNYVAEHYIVGLDPELNVDVRRDAVMARINKFTQGDPYYEYLWGAFSRGKKQEDVQLYVTIHSDHVEYGLSLGSASADARRNLARGLREFGFDLLDSVFGPGDDMQVWIGDSEEEAHEDDLGIEHIVAAAERGTLSVFKAVWPDDPLMGSADLADDIGRVLAQVYPLAALAWGEQLEYVEGPLSDESALPEYTLDHLVRDTSLPPELLEEWIELLRGPKRAGLFFGPPGTGKTHVVEHLARHLAGTDGKTATVQFHPSFSYEDFIEGLRPVMDGGQLGYEIRDGVFKTFCEEARGKEANHVFIIDEINRAELGSVLGEVMMLIEYRGRRVPLPYSQRPFSIPKNVVLLATMNTADRSLALVDFALRRRFHALKMLPDRDVLSAYHGGQGKLAVEMFDIVQRHVDNEDYMPGHSYWMLDDVSSEGLQRLWTYELRPYLSEYWFETRSRLDELENEVLALLGEGA